MNTKKSDTVIQLVLSVISRKRAMGYTELAEKTGRSRDSVANAIREHRQKKARPFLRIAAYDERDYLPKSPLFMQSAAPDVDLPQRDSREKKRHEVRKARERYLAKKIAMELAAAQGVDYKAEASSADRDILAAKRKAQADIERNLARLRPLAGNVWSVCAVQVGAM